jgi:putative glutathione S-transferase
MLRIGSSAASSLRFKNASIRLTSRSASSSFMTDTTSRKDGSTKWASNDGKFRRQESSFRDFISTEKGVKFAPALNRYHLVTALACPWAHRTMIARKLKGIDKVPGLLPLHTVDSLLGPEGWSFVPSDDPPNLGIPGSGNKIPGHESKKRIREFYLEANPVSRIV